MRKALVVGINYYPHLSHLSGCVPDAQAISKVLDSHMNGAKNFEVKQLIATDQASQIPCRRLRQNIEALFADDDDIALLYFAGHGHIDDAGGYLLTSDCQHGDVGVSLEDVLTFANESKAKNKILIFDSCYSGAAGSPVSMGKKAVLSEGMTIMTASGRAQTAEELSDGGIFTSLFVDAMMGGAAGLEGDITPASIYAHIDKSLGGWGQRPVFKTNVKRSVSLRQVKPPIELTELKQIRALFDSPKADFPLNPSFEPHPPQINPQYPPNEVNVTKFGTLQTLCGLNLVRPVGEKHMYYAAMHFKSCKLTALGEHYWKLIEQSRL